MTRSVFESGSVPSAHLVSHEEQTLLGGKSDDVFDALSVLNLACGQRGLMSRMVVLLCTHLVALLKVRAK